MTTRKTNLAPILLSLLPLLWTFFYLSCAPYQSPTTVPTTAPNGQSSIESSAQKVYRLYGQHLQDANILYEQIAISVGEAYGRGLIKPDQHDRILQLERQVEQSLRLAKTALQLYTSSPDDPTVGHDLSAKMLEYDRLLLQLRTIAHDGGIL